MFIFVEQVWTGSWTIRSKTWTYWTKSDAFKISIYVWGHRSWIKNIARLICLQLLVTTNVWFFPIDALEINAIKRLIADSIYPLWKINIYEKHHLYLHKLVMNELHNLTSDPIEYFSAKRSCFTTSTHSASERFEIPTKMPIVLEWFIQVNLFTNIMFVYSGTLCCWSGFHVISSICSISPARDHDLVRYNVATMTWMNPEGTDQSPQSYLPVTMCKNHK